MLSSFFLSLQKTAMEILLYDILKKLELESPSLGLSYVDEDFGQLEMLDEEGNLTYPLTFPSVLCSVQGVTWSDNEELRQEGAATVSVKLLIDCYDDTHAGSTQIDKIIERSELNRDVTKMLHGMRILDNTSMLTRVSSQSYNATHLIKVYETTYSAKVWEKFDEIDTTKVQTIKLSTALKKPQ